MDYKKLKEEPLKSAVQQDFFNNYKYTQIGNIDFDILFYFGKQAKEFRVVLRRTKYELAKKIDKMKRLARRIEPKVYSYGFLK